MLSDVLKILTWLMTGASQGIGGRESRKVEEVGREMGPQGSRAKVAAVEAEGAGFHGTSSKLLNSFLTLFSSL